MAAVEEASTVVGACTPAAVADPAEGRIRHPLPAIEVHLLQRLLLRGQGAGTQRGPVTAILDPGAIPRLGINVLEIPLRRPLVSPTVVGIRLPAHLEAAVPRARNRKLGPQAMREVFTFSVAIVGRDLLVRRVAFRGRVAKSGRMHPPRKMLSPGLNRFPPYTTRSAAHPL